MSDSPVQRFLTEKMEDPRSQGRPQIHPGRARRLIGRKRKPLGMGKAFDANGCHGLGCPWEV